MDLKLFAILLISFGLCSALPISEDKIVNDDNDGENAEYGGYYEGDMILNYEQMSSILYENKRNGQVDEKYRWPGNIVFYEIKDGDFDEAHVEYIKEGMRRIEEVTCIKFRPRTATTKNYVHITGDTSGCHSAVGRHSGEQNINYAPYPLGEGCFRLGSIMHEFIHALGFFHQQSASDRDDYVTIIKENIIKGYERNFNKYPPSIVTDFGVPYDYGSIMHYSSRAFSKNGEVTIDPIDKTVRIGQRIAMSPSDIKKINLMYKCPGY